MTTLTGKRPTSYLLAPSSPLPTPHARRDHPRLAAARGRHAVRLSTGDGSRHERRLLAEASGFPASNREADRPGVLLACPPLTHAHSAHHDRIPPPPLLHGNRPLHVVDHVATPSGIEPSGTALSVSITLGGSQPRTRTVTMPKNEAGASIMHPCQHHGHHAEAEVAGNAHHGPGEHST